jgi:NAD(P)-dependent dehydrogenase (short-subunit alcohol dehydrogenase family)
MRIDLNDMRILVTGGTSGIGRAIVVAAAEAGADVAFCGLTDEGAGAVAVTVEGYGRRAYFETLDVGDLEACRAFVGRVAGELGGLDGLVNNAGTNFNHGVLGATAVQIDRCFRVNFYSAWAMAQAAHPYLKAAGRGVVVNISSIHATQTMPGAFPYNASKAAMSALTQSMAIEWAADNILSVAIAPGWTLTPLNIRAFDHTPDPDAERRRIDEAHLLGRMANPEDIASFAVYLLSGANGSLNGNTVRIDGGQHTRAYPH